MANTNLSGVQLAAALAEGIYRRSGSDLPINLSADILVNQPPVGDIAGFRRDGSYYYTSRGFVGEVVEKGGLCYVVIRGTDSAEDFSVGAVKAVAAGMNQTAPDASGRSDLGDWTNNIILGTGTTELHIRCPRRHVPRLDHLAERFRPGSHSCAVAASPRLPPTPSQAWLDTYDKWLKTRRETKRGLPSPELQSETRIWLPRRHAARVVQLGNHSLTVRCNGLSEAFVVAACTRRIAKPCARLGSMQKTVRRRPACFLLTRSIIPRDQD